MPNINYNKRILANYVKMTTELPKINEKNIFVYWTGPANDYILLMRALMILHSNNGQNYHFFVVCPDNLSNFIDDPLPEVFHQLKPAHQADWVRVNLIYKYGGIWIDSDMIIIDNTQITDLFNMIYNTPNQDGFFVNEGRVIYNGVFGSRANTLFFAKLRLRMNKILAQKGTQIHWVEIGNSLYTHLFITETHKYKVLDGENTIYPVIYYNMGPQMLAKDYDNYKQVEKPWQPILVITQNGAINELMLGKTYKDILDMKYPLNYFINKSIRLSPVEYRLDPTSTNHNNRLTEIIQHLESVKSKIPATPN
jgi:hypothetical protein